MPNDGSDAPAAWAVVPILASLWGHHEDSSFRLPLMKALHPHTFSSFCFCHTFSCFLVWSRMLCTGASHASRADGVLLTHTVYRNGKVACTVCPPTTSPVPPPSFRSTACECPANQVPKPCPCLCVHWEGFGVGLVCKECRVGSRLQGNQRR